MRFTVECRHLIKSGEKAEIMMLHALEITKIYEFYTIQTAKID